MQVMVGNNYGSYTFNAATGVITLLNLPSSLEAGQVKLIINAKTNTIIFNLADPTQTATFYNNTITLAYNTSLMNNADPLQIFMDVPGYFVTQNQTSLAPMMTAVAGITNEATPEYRGIPLTASGVSVKVDGSAITQPVSGTVAVSNFPVTQPVSGTVAVSNDSIAVTGTFWQATQPVSGTVAVSNFPSSQHVTVDNPTTSVSVSNLPDTQPVSGTVAVSNFPSSQMVSGSVSVSNFPSTQATSATQLPVALDASGYLKTHEQGVANVSVQNSVAVTGTFWQATQLISGSVSVSNLPSTQAVSSTQLPTSLDDSGNFKVAVENTSIPVTGTFWQETQPVSGSISVSNFPDFPTTQPVSGTVAISGTVPVSGTFYPATQPVSGTVTSNQGTAAAGAKWSVQVDNASAIAVTNSSAETSLSTIAGTVSAAQMQVNVANTSIPVTGDFYPATQPVSGAVNVTGTITPGSTTLTPLVVIGGLTNDTIPQYQELPLGPGGNAVLVNGSAFTQPVSGSVLITNQAIQYVNGTLTGTTPTGNLMLGQSSRVVQAVQTDISGNLNINTLPGGAGFTQDTPEFTAISGDPAGDFAGVNLLETMMDTASGIGLNYYQLNLPKQDATGAQMVSDAPKVITWVTTGAQNNNSGLIDTTGYQSIVVSFSASVGTILFQTSNDPAQFTAALSNAAAWISAGSGSPATSFAAAAGATYIVPVTGRWFRLYTSVAGSLGTVTIYLRAVQVATPITSSTVNVNQIGGALAGTNVSGSMGVGGTTAVGTAPPIYPVTMGGVDPGGLVRRILTDTTGRLVPSAPDIVGTYRTLGVQPPPFSGTTLAALATAEQTLSEGNTQTDLLQQILLELKIMSYLLFHMPTVQTLGQGFQQSEEPSNFRSEQSALII